MSRLYATILFAAPPFVLFAASGCGGAPPTDETGRDVVEWVFAKGGKVQLTSSDRTFARVEELPQGPLGVKSIDLTGVPVTDRDLERFEPLAHLESLVLYRSRVTNAGLESVIKLADLRLLNLSYTRVTDEGVAKLTRLRRLRKLFLRETAVSEEAATNLQNEISGLQVFLK